MLHQKVCFVVLFFAMALFVTPCVSWADDEHPSEHPSEPKEHSEEHPSEHPAKETESVTKESLAVAIEKYVEEEAELKGGYFMVFDQKDKKALALTLDKVHKERLSHIKEDVYFACADFKEVGGKMYDLDIFMKGNSVDELEVAEIIVHKKDGKERYGWVYDEEKDVWKREENKKK